MKKQDKDKDKNRKAKVVAEQVSQNQEKIKSIIQVVLQ